MSTELQQPVRQAPWYMAPACTLMTLIVLNSPRSGHCNPAPAPFLLIPVSHQALAPVETTSMDDAKVLTLPDISEAFMKTADVVLVLDDGTGIECHSKILSMHSSVLCNMLADFSTQNDGIGKVPLAGFTKTQCSALLAYLNSFSTSTRAFKGHGAVDHDAAVVVARFAHAYDMPHALRHVEAYLTSFMETHFKTKKFGGLTGETGDKVVLEWALMADTFDMHELCGHCERAMVMYWEHFNGKPKLINQLSSGALQRIAKGLHKTLAGLVDSLRWHSIVYGAGYTSKKSADKCFPRKYPDAREFTAWRQQKQPAAK